MIELTDDIFYLLVKTIVWYYAVNGRIDNRVQPLTDEEIEAYIEKYNYRLSELPEKLKEGNLFEMKGDNIILKEWTDVFEIFETEFIFVNKDDTDRLDILHGDFCITWRNERVNPYYQELDSLGIVLPYL